MSVDKVLTTQKMEARRNVANKTVTHYSHEKVTKGVTLDYKNGITMKETIQYASGTLHLPKDQLSHADGGTDLTWVVFLCQEGTNA